MKTVACMHEAKYHLRFFIFFGVFKIQSSRAHSVLNWIKAMFGPLLFLMDNSLFVFGLFLFVKYNKIIFYIYFNFVIKYYYLFLVFKQLKLLIRVILQNYFSIIIFYEMYKVKYRLVNMNEKNSFVYFLYLFLQ